MRKTYLYIALGLGVAGIGFLAYKNLRRKDTESNIGEEDFPLYLNEFCNDNVDGGCPFDARVLDVQEFLVDNGFNIEEDGLFGNETASAINNYIDSLSEEEYTALGYNYVEIPNYITLAFYKSIS